MQNDPKTSQAFLLWLDLEMTGIDLDKDIIIEVASKLTDFNFLELNQIEAIINHPKEKVLALMDANPWWEEVKDNKNFFLENLDKGITTEDAEDLIIDSIKNLPQDSTIYLAGNSIHMDRRFVTKYFPRLNQILHYRMLDVSAFKVIFSHKFNITYMKKNTHRAMDDIEESINELKYYLNFFNLKNEN